ncbi:unnamed protein product [Zymoseptoria tritici ST99CH_1E4]|uniref:Uncharacterized protein n=1 Tax=Zymoseptoria tritici ST99CH_1E4 TaxID=1276532 RepID=A0A2H1H4H8_ZYMTR|nr:unnamed protein product [Zymoseptoria tritici ST99CH_1E4]
MEDEDGARTALRTHNPQANLQDIAPELRLNIYEGLWLPKERKSTIHTDDSERRISQRKPPQYLPTGKTRTALLRVNKQIYKEAVTILHKNSELALLFFSCGDGIVWPMRYKTPTVDAKSRITSIRLSADLAEQLPIVLRFEDFPSLEKFQLLVKGLRGGSTRAEVAADTVCKLIEKCSANAKLKSVAKSAKAKGGNRDLAQTHMRRRTVAPCDRKNFTFRSNFARPNHTTPYHSTAQHITTYHNNITMSSQHGTTPLEQPGKAKIVPNSVDGLCGVRGTQVKEIFVLVVWLVLLVAPRLPKPQQRLWCMLPAVIIGIVVDSLGATCVGYFLGTTYIRIAGQSAGALFNLVMDGRALWKEIKEAREDEAKRLQEINEMELLEEGNGPRYGLKSGHHLADTWKAARAVPARPETAVAPQPSPQTLRRRHAFTYFNLSFGTATDASTQLLPQ